jgi:hypothetical protein
MRISAAEEHTWSKFGDYTVNVLSFYAVDNVVTGPRDEMSVGENVNILL